MLSRTTSDVRWSDVRRGWAKAEPGGSRYGWAFLSGEWTLILLALLGRVSSSMCVSSGTTGSLLRFPLVFSNSSSEPANQVKGAVTMFLMVPKNELERARGAGWWF